MGSIGKWNEIFEGIYNLFFFEAEIKMMEDISEEVLLPSKGEDYFEKRQAFIAPVSQGEDYFEKMEAFIEPISQREDMLNTCPEDFYSLVKNEVEEQFDVKVRLPMEDIEAFYPFENVEEIFSPRVKKVVESLVFPQAAPLGFKGDSQNVGGTLKSESMRERLLKMPHRENEVERKDIKIELKADRSMTEEFDTDSITDMLTEKLCELMSRGTDGLYV